MFSYTVLKVVVMYKIFKYEFEVEDEPTVQMPEGAEIVKVECQGQQPCIWAIVTPGNLMKDYKFLMRGTGHPLPTNCGKHIATFQQVPFVWHIFQGPDWDK